MNHFQFSLIEAEEPILTMGNTLSQSAHEMANNLAMLDAVIEATVDGILVYALDYHIVKMNSNYCALLNLDKYEAYLSSVLVHLELLEKYCDNATAFKRRFLRHTQKNEVDRGFILKFKNERYFQVTHSPYLVNGVLLGKVLSFHDITLEKKNELILIEREALYKDLSIRDNLTGIFNRRKILLELKKCYENLPNSSQMTSLIIFDLDNFKAINDTYGHSMGDFVLQRISESIGSCLRKKDVFARWGGDEFVVLMPDCDRHKAEKTTQKIKSRLSNLCLPLKSPISCTFGISTTKEENCPEMLIHRADMAMYHSKNRSGYTREIK